MQTLSIPCSVSTFNEYSIPEVNGSDRYSNAPLFNQFRAEVVTKHAVKNPMGECKAQSKTNRLKRQSH